MHNRVVCSFLIPIYNKEKTLFRCLESILSQNNNEIEIILVDDASEDKSFEIALDFSSRFENIILFRNKVNKGVATSRNKCIDLANGDYVTFVDADDHIQQNCITNIINLLKIEKDIDILIARYDVRNANYVEFEQAWNQELIKLEPGKKFWHYVKEFTTICFSSLFSRKFLDEFCIAFIDGVRIGEDLEFMLKALLQAKRIEFYTKEFYVHYRYIGTAKSIRDDYANSDFLVLSSLLDIYEKYSIISKSVDVLLIEKISILLEGLISTLSIKSNSDRYKLSIQNAASQSKISTLPKQTRFLNKLADYRNANKISSDNQILSLSNFFHKQLIDLASGTSNIIIFGANKHAHAISKILTECKSINLIIVDNNQDLVGSKLGITTIINTESLKKLLSIDDINFSRSIITLRNEKHIKSISTQLKELGFDKNSITSLDKLVGF